MDGRLARRWADYVSETSTDCQRTKEKQNEIDSTDTSNSWQRPKHRSTSDYRLSESAIVLLSRTIIHVVIFEMSKEELYILYIYCSTTSGCDRTASLYGQN